MKHSNQIHVLLHSSSSVETLLLHSILTLHRDNNIDDKLKQQIENFIKENEKLWSEIHECIQTDNLKQLKALLSKHTINLNCLNKFINGDTILHSAAKSRCEDDRIHSAETGSKHQTTNEQDVELSTLSPC
jgi:hypothetical protein